MRSIIKFIVICSVACHPNTGENENRSIRELGLVGVEIHRGESTPVGYRQLRGRLEFEDPVTDGISFNPGPERPAISEYLANEKRAVRLLPADPVDFRKLSGSRRNPKYLSKILKATRGGASMTARKRELAGDENDQWHSWHFDAEASGRSVELTDEGRQLLGRNGFVVVRQKEQSFLTGYEFVFINDLPVFITADGILHAVYRSAHLILSDVGHELIGPQLESLLKDLHDDAVAGELRAFDQQIVLDVDFYLTIARAILIKQPNRSTTPILRSRRLPLNPRYRENQDRVTRFWNYLADEEERSVELFGARRTIDFGKFECREPWRVCPRYRLALTWLDVVDFSIAESSPERKFHRRQSNIVLALATLLEKHERSFNSIDQVMSRLIGRSRNLTLTDLKMLREAFGVDSFAQMTKTPVRDLAPAIDQLGSGVRRVRREPKLPPSVDENVAPSTSFSILGRRVAPELELLARSIREVDGRLGADSTDVAYALFNNEVAREHLQPNGGDAKSLELALDGIRNQINGTPADVWQTSVYLSWVDVLRELSPINRPKSNVPAVAQTKAWSTRLMNTQLASWAELRNIRELSVGRNADNFTGCEFPAVFVEPAPEFWRALERLANQFETLPLSRLDDGTEKRIREFVANLREVAQNLGAISRRQAAGKSATREQLRFVNGSIIEARRVSYGSAWYDSPVVLWSDGREHRAAG